MFSEKTLLITGGTGSFGNAVLNRFLDTNIKQIRIFSRDEKKQDDMRNKYKNQKIKFYIGDVRNRDSVDNAMNGVDYVFHAAALKQVPSCEFFPIEATKTNVLGTENVLNSAIAAKAKRVICLSTDKAAYPINAMGISKAMMEKVVTARSRTIESDDTVIACTRYGNVMASRGSVVPLFVEQIKQGGPLTVTNPDMTRFLMSLDEAVDLVLFAFQNASQGDLFVQKAPSATIDTLAKAIQKIFSTRCSITNIGIRHGEKIFETLLTQEESAQCIDMGKFFRVPADNRDLNYESYFNKGTVPTEKISAYTSHNTNRLTIDETILKLLETDYIKKELELWKELSPKSL